MTHPNCLVVVAKEPQPGFSKTRLAQAIGAESAAQVYSAFLKDIAERLPSEPLDADLIWAITPESHPAAFSYLSPTWQLAQQHGDTLGERLQNLLSRFLASGYERVVIMSSDSPDLPGALIKSAFVRLQDHDAVVGPCHDQGYYLIGQRRFLPELFVDIPWSTSDVMSRTRNQAAQGGIVLASLDTWYDVDYAEDFVTMANWQSLHEPAPIPHTRQALLELGLEGARPPVTANLSPMARQRWAQWKTRPVYQNRWITVREDDVVMPNTAHTVYGVVQCAECVGVVPVLENGDILLVRQFRYVQQDFYWEIPTGAVASGEAPRDAARRELHEEAGVTADSLETLGSFHTSKSVMRETAHLFVARGVQPTSAGHPDDTEFLEVGHFSPEVVKEWVDTGLIMDSMSVIALLRFLGCRPR